MRLIRTATLLAISVLAPLGALADTTASVRGFVRHTPWISQFTDDDPPIRNAAVEIDAPNGVWTTKTDEHGFYVIFGIIPGRYTIKASYGWYFANVPVGFRHICIHAGNDRVVNLALSDRYPDLPNATAIRRRDYVLQFAPYDSQTADVYNIGDSDLNLLGQAMFQSPGVIDLEFWVPHVSKAAQ